ncbi:MAG: cytochrome P450 [Verrucomicrobiota bacterium]
MRRLGRAKKPDLIREILVQKMDNYTKDTLSFRMVSVVLGESTFTAMGDSWKRKRQLAQPSFHKNRIANLGQIMTDTIGQMLDQWEAWSKGNEVINVAEEMMRLTLRVVVKALFSTGLSEKEVQTVADIFTPLLEDTNHRITLPFKLLHAIPTAKNRAYQKYIDQLDEIIYRIIKDRKASNKEYNDLLQMLMDARTEETNEPLSEQELRDEVMTIFIAGHETTANAMSWVWYILSQKPAILAKVKAEVAQVLGDRVPTARDFPQLEYCLKVFKETMRLYPPVPMLPRHVEQDDQLGGYHIKGGDDVFFGSYLLHRRPDFWENPEQFDPHRFDKEQERKRHTFAYLPFGGGPRICLGNNFALMEAVFIMAMTVQRYDLELKPGHQVEPLITLTTRPKGGMPMSIESLT